jgi:hypothetical protein
MSIAAWWIESIGKMRIAQKSFLRENVIRIGHARIGGTATWGMSATREDAALEAIRK